MYLNSGDDSSTVDLSRLTVTWDVFKWSVKTNNSSFLFD